MRQFWEYFSILTITLTIGVRLIHITPIQKGSCRDYRAKFGENHFQAQNMLISPLFGYFFVIVFYFCNCPSSTQTNCTSWLDQLYISTWSNMISTWPNSATRLEQTVHLISSKQSFLTWPDSTAWLHQQSNSAWPSMLLDLNNLTPRHDQYCISTRPIIPLDSTNPIFWFD